jgi:hypothetical protein
MLVIIDLETFKQLTGATGNLIYYKENNEKIFMYSVKEGVLLHTYYEFGVDEETGIPKVEDALMFKQSFLTNAVRVIDVKTEQTIKMGLTNVNN